MIMLNTLLVIDINIINLIISIVAAIIGISALSLSISIYIKIENKKDSNKIRRLEQTIENGSKNTQAGRDANE